MARTWLDTFLLGPRISIRDDRGRRVKVFDPGLLPSGEADAESERVARRTVWAEAWRTRSLGCAVVPLIGLIAATTQLILHRCSLTEVLVFLALLMLGIAGVWGGPTAADARRIASHIVRRGYCGSCGYSTSGLEPAPDGCVVCPECRAAWRAPAHAQEPGRQDLTD